MKLPHLNLLFFLALLVFTSCGKEAVTIPEAEPTQDTSIGMRCCDDVVADLVKDPRFIDFYDSFTNGIYNPALSLFDQFDNDALLEAFDTFNDCVASGGNIDDCIGQSEILTRLFDIINGFDMSTLITLLQGYDFLNPDDFTFAVTEAVNQMPLGSTRQLSCFMQFREDMLTATLAGGILAAGTGGIVGALGIIAGIIAARYKFCDCLYSTYGGRC